MPRPIDPAVRLAFSRKLRAWFRRNSRDLPWRRSRVPWGVLVSELMLQQTQVPRVLARFGPFLEQFPTVAACCAASPLQCKEN